MREFLAGFITDLAILDILELGIGAPDKAQRERVLVYSFKEMLKQTSRVISSETAWKNYDLLVKLFAQLAPDFLVWIENNKLALNRILSKSQIDLREELGFEP